MLAFSTETPIEWNVSITVRHGTIIATVTGCCTVARWHRNTGTMYSTVTVIEPKDFGAALAPR
jgi:hypothetical protein